MRPVPLEPCMGLIKAFEGKDGTFEATRQQDPGGLWEIGWSHRITPEDPLWDATLVASDADALAAKDLDGFAADVCDALTDPIVTSLTEGQWAAILSFVYNVGPGTFIGSTFCRLIKAGNMVQAPGELKKWVYGKVNGVETILPGLVRRRNAELAVWRAPV